MRRALFLTHTPFSPERHLSAEIVGELNCARQPVQFLYRDLRCASTALEDLRRDLFADEIDFLIVTAGHEVCEAVEEPDDSVVAMMDPDVRICAREDFEPDDTPAEPEIPMMFCPSENEETSDGIAALYATPVVEENSWEELLRDAFAGYYQFVTLAELEEV